MKKITLTTLALLLIAGSVFVITQDVNAMAGQTQVNKQQQAKTESQTPQTQGGKILTEDQPQNSQENITQKGNQVQIENKVQNKGELTQLKEQIKVNLEDGEGVQNQVRATVQNLLLIKDYTDSEFGKQVSQVAEQFNNSMQSMNQAEEKIQNRSGLVKFFLGGDKESAKQINNQIQANNQNLEQLKLSLNNCACDQEVKEMAQEQAQQMEQEQLRLQKIASNQLKSNGIFGWITNFFNK